MLSYWEQTSLLHYDFVIIGSGITGMQAALHLRKKRPKSSIVILERGILPSGASTRNAGFACFGSIAELYDDMQAMPEEEVRGLFASRKMGIELLRAQFGDDAIGYRAEGSHELLGEEEHFLLEKIDFFNDLLRDFSKHKLFEEQTARISEFGLNSSRFKYCIEAKLEGSVHTGKLMRALLESCSRQGIQIITGAQVLGLSEDKNSVNVEVADTLRGENLCFEAGRVLICTNAFSKRFFPEEEMQPGRGQVLITEPIPNLKLQGIFHYDRGYFYFREIEGRVLLGGGRNLAFEEEATTNFGANERILQRLENDLREHILPLHPSLDLAQSWSGIMAFGRDKRPILKRKSERILGAFRLGGMGVALGSKLGQDLADLALE